MSGVQRSHTGSWLGAHFVRWGLGEISVNGVAGKLRSSSVACTPFYTPLPLSIVALAALNISLFFGH